MTVPRLQEVHVAPRPLDELAGLALPERIEQLRAASERMAERFGGRAIWNVNSTASGGGVAELLPFLVAHARGGGVDVRWVVIGGEESFFRVTKRLHHALHGEAGDGSPLGDDERHTYERVLHENAVELGARVGRGDVVLLHDPQTAGLAPALRRAGALVAWRCHVGPDEPGEHVDEAWRFLRPYVDDLEAFVFTRESFAPSWVGRERLHVIQPSIDALSPKNRDMEPASVRGILRHVGVIGGSDPDDSRAFRHADGSPGRVERSADLVTLGPPPPADAPLVVQVSRWDPLKDFSGLMKAFTRACDGGEGAPADAHLVLVGPNVHAVSDDPEGPAVFDALEDEWRALPHGIRRRVHLAMLPTADVDENAAIVNALQRHAAVVVQKSLHEGFGLTVTEAAWKSRPLVASRVGGIQDQLEHEVTGLLLDDPKDVDACARAISRVLCDRGLAQRLGEAARERVRDQFLADRHLLDHAALLESLDEADAR